MKKAAIIVMLIIEVVLLFIFQNLYVWFNELGGVNLASLKNPYELMNSIQRMTKIFSGLSIITGLMIIGTGFYLVYQFKKAKEKQSFESIPPLQNYLLQLKGSETQLKGLVEQQQEDVTEKEELNKSIINNIDAAVIFLNRKRRVDIFNTVAQQLFSQSYVNAKNNLHTIVLSKFPEIHEIIDQYQESKFSGEVKCGEWDFHIDTNPLENIGQLVLIRDITEEKRREELVRRNDNFIMLGEMAAFLAHEVRNSLGVIYGYTKTIKLEKEAERVEKINKEINFLTSMMESFLNFSRPIKIHKSQTIDLLEIFTTSAAESGIKLETEIANDSEDKVQLETDPTLFHSIVSNLMLNAKEAGADKIQLNAEQHADKRVVITLTDNGNGIDSEIREKIWFPFFTTKAKGTGMGLALIRKMITSMNGEITLLELREGTGFRIVFY
jgi:signal transduction histidine kinase